MKNEERCKQLTQEYSKTPEQLSLEHSGTLAYLIIKESEILLRTGTGLRKRKLPEASEAQMIF